jgi:hypothetical protein
MNLQEVIELIKRRPGEFFGNVVTVEAICNFIRGFIYAKTNFIGMDSFEEVFREKFTEFIYLKYDVIIESVIIFWYEVIRDNSESEIQATKRFFELYDDFYELYNNGFYNGKLQRDNF